MSNVMLEPSVEAELSDSAVRIRVSTSELATCLSRAKVTVATGEALQVLQNIAIRIQQGAVYLETFNMALGLRQELTTAETVADDRTLLVRYGLLSDIVSVAPGTSIDMEVVDDSVVITSGSARWSTRLALAEWPAMPFGMTEDIWDEIPRDWLIAGIERVQKAAATDSVRPALQLLDISGTRIRAADGQRLHQVEREAQTRFTWKVPVSRSQSILRVLRSLLEDGVLIRSESGYTLLSSLDGTVLLGVVGTSLVYPNVDEVILLPSMSNSKIMTCDRKELVHALEAVRVTVESHSRVVRLVYRNNVLQVSSADTKGSTSAVPVPASWAGKTESHSSAFDCTMILDLLTSLTEDDVQIKFGADTAVRPSTAYVVEDSSGFRGVLTQMRLP